MEVHELISKFSVSLSRSLWSTTVSSWFAQSSADIVSQKVAMKKWNRKWRLPLSIERRRTFALDLCPIERQNYR
jgi:hypothetical protein